MTTSVLLSDVMACLETWAPPSYQESYDNSRLLTGSPSARVTGVLVTLDCTEPVVEEAISLNCNVIVAHHPILFRGLKHITGRTYVERTLIKAIKHDIAIYALHTNLDNIYSGVNQSIAARIGLLHTRVLAPKPNTLRKLVTFIPKADTDRVLNALYEAGAGTIGEYTGCSFQVAGTGTFTPSNQANPAVGERGRPETVEETRAEVVFPAHLTPGVLSALRAHHPYESVAYYLQDLQNENPEVGAGLVGTLPRAEEPAAFLKRLKEVMNTECVRHTDPTAKSRIERVAVCGGAGISLLAAAIRQQADVFVTADVKYHDFFEADGKIILADIGHYESEQFTKDRIGAVLQEKFATFAVNFSKTVTNPISYL